MTELWDLNEVAKRTKTSVALWRKLVSERKISIIRVGRCVRLEPERVSAYLASRTQQARGNGLSPTQSISRRDAEEHAEKHGK
jgi:excisionase family DNA binding protein